LILIRRARPGDLPALARLCAAHAAYERAEHEPAGLAERLAVVLFGPSPKIIAWVVAEQAALLGYASATIDHATWTAQPYLHLDCLYLEPSLRGRGWGRRLMKRALAFARLTGCQEVQWQTPDWNAEAIRFYQRLGARGRAKVRFSLAV